MKAKKRPERYLMKVGKGILFPIDELTSSRLRDKGYRVGDEVFVELKKPRNPLFHRYVHALCGLASENLDAFTGWDAHKILKRLQWEANIQCEVLYAQVQGITVEIKIPRSLSFADMDEAEFHDVYKAICRHLGEHYWGGLSADEVAEMAAMMSDSS